MWTQRLYETVAADYVSRGERPSPDDISDFISTYSDAPPELSPNPRRLRRAINRAALGAK